jgi:hypothetical protein
LHDTAYEHGRLFFALYCAEGVQTIVELGSQDVNGALRSHAPTGARYIGLDVMPAKGVDVVVNPDAPLPLASDCADAIVTSSAFEHDICFWDTFLELTRILRPGGLLYVNAPSNGEFHRYPLDCWRFYPDAGVALTRWAARRGTQMELVESFIGQPQAERWADFVAVFRKAGGQPLAGRGRIADHVPALNVHTQADGLLNQARVMPDMAIADTLRSEVAAAHQRNETLAATATSLSDEVASLSQDVHRLNADDQTLTYQKAALWDEFRSLSSKTEALAAELAESRRDLATIQSSTFWRATAPLRRLIQATRGR